MLTACIVYIPGSAGNLLARCLSLDPTTVPYGKALSAKDRLLEYNNWNNKDWVSSEVGLEIPYMRGHGDFYTHETDMQKLVHRLHPDQFIDGKENIWTGDYQWQNLIFIAPDDIETIKKLAETKRTDMDHNSLLNKQLKMYQSLLQESTYTINFTDLLAYDTFSAEVEKICSIIDVVYYKDYVKQIWHKWHKETTHLVWLPK